VIGSFLNVLIHRLPLKNKKASEGRSECPACGQQLKWYHNIPIISWLFLRGKCGFCHEKISLRYPLVELLNALLFVYFWWQFGHGYHFYIFAGLGSALLTIFFIDYDHQIIPDLITLPGMILGLAVSLLPEGMGILSSFIGLLVGGGSLYLVAMLGDFLFKKESMGGGDIKMAAMLGAFLGWQKVLLIFISSAVIGLVISVAIMIFSAKLRENRVVPFGPFLALAAVGAMIYGDQLISFYIHTVVGLP
jgi:leader peptidase (prepilin peptidase)/N-methyltransferase